MNKNEILKLLQSKINRVKLPSDMEFFIDTEKKELIITLSPKGICSNMQTDAAAFEGWAICLKAWLPEYITNVKIAGEIPTFPATKSAIKSKEEKHYNRFLYRLEKFIKTYKWAFSDDYTNAIKEFAEHHLIINVPMKNKKTERASHQEAQLELEYCTQHKDDYDCINHQLPVGLFHNEVTATNAITSRGLIDIWSIKDEILTIFELKIPTNKMVGIISELMFYTNVMSDVMKHRINILEPSKERDFDKLYSLYQNESCKKIKSIFLANEVHPLIKSNLSTVLEIINTGNFLIETEYSYDRPIVAE